MQTLLGAGGAIGTELAKELVKYTTKIRLVSRHPKAVNPTDELFPADLKDAAQVSAAVEGSEVVYLIAGLQYNIKVWQKEWPLIMRNVIEACKKHKAKLVFFDNMYAYDKDHLDPMTEETPINPCSKKGKVRAGLIEMIFNEVKSGQLTALIARSADFISIKNSAIVETTVKNIMNGKRANWLIDANRVHNLTLATDAAKATAILGNTPDAFNQTWHVPSIKARLTGKDWMELIARELKTDLKYSILPMWMLTLLGLFIPVLGELKEMAYQFERDYYFDSSKFEKRFQITPSSPEEAVRWMLNGLKQAESK